MSARKQRVPIKKWCGPALVVLGAFSIVVGAVAPASATAALSVSQDTGLTAGQSVTVSGTGYAANSPGAVLQCNSDAGQPTISVALNDVPVSCTIPSVHSTDGSGNLPSTSFTVHTGTVGPPTAGTDSAGNAAAADATLYPCPPTAAQLAAGDTCVIAFGDFAGDKATHVIHFVGEAVPTTTTAAASTTTTHATTSTTAQATTTTSHATTTTTAGGTTTTTSAPATTTTSQSGRHVSVIPATGLADGDTVSVSGTGFNPGLGVIIECNSDQSQPKIAVSGNPVPVSCTNPVSNLINFDSGGGLAASNFVVHTGTTGPPATGSDDAGHDAAADAALFPCPPTPAQIAAGDSCVIALADIAGHQATQNISFQGEGPTTTTIGSSSTTSTTAKPGVTLVLNTSAPTAGQQVSLSGAGFPSNAELKITFASTPVLLKTVTSDGTGAFSTTITIPADAALGAHEITVSTTDGKVSASIPLTVVAATTNTGSGSSSATATPTTAGAEVLGTQTTNGQVAFTGMDAEEWILLGVFCMISGLLLIAHARVGTKRVMT